MPELLKRRPSAPIVISLIALFVALGGPAQAAKMVRSADVKNRTLQVKDLSKKAVKSLQQTPRGSVGQRALANRAVTNSKLRDGSVTANKIAPAAVGSSQLAPGSVGPRELAPGAVAPAQIADGSVNSAKLADGSVNGTKVADASLDTRDFARFSGRFRVEVPAVEPFKCWSAEPVGLAPEQAGADIGTDLVLVTPGPNWPQNQLSFTVRNSANTSRFVLAACNSTGETSVSADVGFRYAILDIP